MQTSDPNNKETKGLLKEHEKSAAGQVFASQPAFSSKLLSPVLVGGLLWIAGPVVLPAIAQTGLISIQVLLELGSLSLAAFQVLCT